MEKTVLEQYREQFQALANKTYFNYGGQGPMPKVALSAIHRAYEYIQEIGPFSGETQAWIFEEEMPKIRKAIASELAVPPETITLTENVTVGCNIPLWGLNWQAGDHVLITDCEHPGIVAAVGEIARRFRLDVSTFPLMKTLNQGNPLELLAQHLHSNTRLIVLSHILWNTGQVVPLTEIMKLCRKWGKQATHSRKPLVLVDAAQSVGVLPLNLIESGVDFYAFTGHKWWCGPEGLGGLYVSPDAAANLQPSFIGWRGIVTNSAAEVTGFKPDGRRFEVATSAYPLYAGLREAIAIHQQLGTIEERYQRILELSKFLWQKLNGVSQINCLRTAPPEAGLVSFQLDKTLRDAGATHAQLVKFLEKEYRIMVRTILSPDCVRACVHYFTLESEIEQLVEAITAFCQKY